MASNVHAEGVEWQGTGYIFIVKKKNEGTTTLLENRENSQILSFYLFSLASFHQG